MHAAEFLAVIHAHGGEQAALSTAESHRPSSITRLRLAEGGLLLCRWDGKAVPAHGAVATIDGTGGAPEAGLPRHLIDAGDAPASLLAAARQHRSDLWLDDGGRLTCWTDHLGLSRVYQARAGDCLLLSDDPALLAGANPAPDLAGVCSFLVNGYLVRDRTLFANVSSLPLASVITIGPDRTSSTPYWRHQPGADVWTDRSEAGRELWSRVTAAVTARAQGSDAVISLSGGYDSAVLLGILQAAGHPVSAFSFAVGEPRPGSDADVARRRAASLGVAHRIYRFDEEFDIGGMLRSHLESGLIMRKACYEVDAYERACADAPNGAVLFFGDEAFGQGTFRIGNEHELLGSGTLKSPGILSRLAPNLTSDRATELADALWPVYDEILALPRMRTDEDTKDMLFLGAYLCANMVEMRRQTVARRRAIALPHLDLAVIDMARHLPSSLRTDKRFFEAVARRKLPGLFRIKGARTSQAQPVIDIEMRRQRRSLDEAIGHLGQGIPGVISPAALSAALDTLCATPVAPVSRSRKAMNAVLRGAVKRDLIPHVLLDAVRRRYWSKFEAGADAAGLLMRALHLAMTFDRLSAEPEAVAASPPSHAMTLSD